MEWYHWRRLIPGLTLMGAAVTDGITDFAGLQQHIGDSRYIIDVVAGGFGLELVTQFLNAKSSWELFWNDTRPDRYARISFNDEPRSLNIGEKYVLQNAGLQNGTYEVDQFSTTLENTSFGKISENLCGILSNFRTELVNSATEAQTVKIENFRHIKEPLKTLAVDADQQGYIF